MNVCERTRECVWVTVLTVWVFWVREKDYVWMIERESWFELVCVWMSMYVCVCLCMCVCVLERARVCAHACLRTCQWRSMIYSFVAVLCFSSCSRDSGPASICSCENFCQVHRLMSAPHPTHPTPTSWKHETESVWMCVPRLGQTHHT